jgi:hypothetical protein
MASSKKTAAADRSHGGPGSSQRDRTKPKRATARVPPGEPTNSRRSRISGGGGERDAHHTHDPRTKS